MEQPVPKGGMFICRPKPLSFSKDSEQGFTLMSDLHVGARNVDYELIAHELEQAKKNKDRILLNGDVFDMILVQDRKRYRSDVLHPKLLGRNDLVDAAVEWGVKILAPYADMIDMIGVGNHEDCVSKFHGTDVTKNLVYELRKLRKDKEHFIHYGGYTGFIDHRISYNGDKGHVKDRRKRFVIYYHHGAGGNAPITKGMIDFSRLGWVDADVIWLGHRHARLASSVLHLSCPLAGNDPVNKEIRHIQTGAYFDTYCGQSQASLEEHGRITNYAADMKVVPQGKGGARVLLSFNGRNDDYQIKVIQ